MTDTVKNPGKKNENNVWGTIQTQDLIILDDAEKILGEESLLTDSSSDIKEEVSVYKCTYTAVSKDVESGKTGNIYFMFENYNLETSARNIYESIRKANQNHEGIKILKDIGDEAYYHSDGENFYFILARKNTKIIRMKVNKITSKTSLDEFMNVARKIIAGI